MQPMAISEMAADLFDEEEEDAPVALGAGELTRDALGGGGLHVVHARLLKRVAHRLVLELTLLAQIRWRPPVYGVRADGSLVPLRFRLPGLLPGKRAAGKRVKLDLVLPSGEHFDALVVGDGAERFEVRW